ncbi:MAG TPA: TIGR03085 family protein, partial [Dermatophilaceae bacterium]
ARLKYARSGVGVVLVAPGYARRQVHAMTDLGTIVLKGTPGELLLYSFGRRDVARVDLSGPQEALSAI